MLLLLCYVLENAIRRSKVETLETTLDKCSQIMVHADGVVNVRRILQGVKEVFTSLVKQMMGLEINEKRHNL
jgi:hypothetical protein